MKKLVIINFDDQYINTSYIISNAINLMLYNSIKENAPIVSREDVECEINKPLELLLWEVLDQYGNYPLNEDQIKYVKDIFDENIITEAFLSNGIQEFLHVCQYFEIEVRIITNKPLETVRKCVEHFTPNLIEGIDAYKEEPSGLKLIDRLIKERKLKYSDVLIISSTDFNDEYLNFYEYSTNYCSDNIFSDYSQLIDVLHDEEILFPTIRCSLDFVMEKKVYSKVKQELEKHSEDIEVMELKNNKEILILVNQIEKECKQDDGNSMYLENILEECIEPFLDKKEILDRLRNEYKCEISLTSVISCQDTKINPSISPSKKVIKFCADNDIEFVQDLYL